MHNFLKKRIGGKKQDDLVVQHEHTIIVDPAVAPTCTAEGLTEGSHCSICREVLVPQQAIPVTGHHYDATVTDPTCTAGGFTVYKCSACGDTYTADETAARGHTEVIHAAIAPKCTKDGLTEGTHCSVCK